MAVKVGIVSLGCPKNLVDSEVMLGLLKAGNFRICEDVSRADVAIINTCSFIRDAKTESIETILQIAGLKANGRPRKIIVTGCLPQRYPEIKDDLPEVDAFVGTADFPNIVRVVKAALAGERRSWCRSPERSCFPRRRLLLTPRHFAYLKISEGCNNRCRYCVIPRVRGSYRSRSLDSLVEEARRLADKGVRELNLISQDITLYGTDRYRKPRLADLLELLAKVKQLRWIRLLYAHPAHVSPGLIDVIRDEEKICKYLDLPIQHANDAVLRRMGRKIGKAGIRELIERLRQEIPGIALRTTVMVGFPGETERRFEELLEFVRRTRFEHLGVFNYSKEEGTPAFAFSGQVSEKVKNRRMKALMTCQQEIVRDWNRRLLGKTVEVLIDEKIPDSRGKFIGRTAAFAPEVDGVVYVSSRRGRPGEFLTVRITDTLEYDLVGVETGGVNEPAQ